jgi:NAD(P)-dependent dehydrogenase (short-subunit alcohol dehydrogenase family)
VKSFAGKVAVVTGAGSGIGRELAIQLGRDGALVAAVDRDLEAAKETTVAIEHAGGRARPYGADVTDSAAMNQLAEQVTTELGDASVLVNNAGIMLPFRPIDEISLEEFQRLVAVNLWGVVHGTKAFLPQLRRQPEAAIVNMASVGGLMAMLQQGPYSTIKYAVRGWSDNLAMDLAETGITVTTVYPGPVDTNIIAHCAGYTDGERHALEEGYRKVRRSKADTVAAQTLAGIRNKKARVLVGAETRVADVLVRLLPGTYVRLLYRPMKKAIRTVTGR